jgi:pilus assembly protein CpaE
MLLGLDSVWLEAECSRYEFFFDVVEQSQPEIALVSLDVDPDKALDLVAKVVGSTPTCHVLVVSAYTDGEMILRAMRAGAKEFLPQPLKIEDFLAALQRIKHGRGGLGNRSDRSSTALAVIGASGGVGCTSLAVNLGCSLARNESNSVVLIDLDLTLGDADVCLDIIPDYTIVDVAQNIGRLDFSLLKRSLAKHASGLHLLPRPVQMEDAAAVGVEEIRRIIGLLKATFTHVLLDTSKSFSPIDIAALQLCDQILLVTQLDLPCLRNVVRLLMGLGQYDGMTDKVRVVMNRQGRSSVEISLKKAQDTIGKEIFWKLPNDYSTIVQARNNGVPLFEFAPRAKITQAIDALAAALDEGAAPEGDTSKERRGLLRFLS